MCFLDTQVASLLGTQINGNNRLLECQIHSYFNFFPDASQCQRRARQGLVLCEVQWQGWQLDHSLTPFSSYLSYYAMLPLFHWTLSSRTCEGMKRIVLMLPIYFSSSSVPSRATVTTVISEVPVDTYHYSSSTFLTLTFTPSLTPSLPHSLPHTLAMAEVLDF